MLPCKCFLSPAADVDLAQLAVQRGRNQVEMSAKVAERLHP
jgi:hypothetical protein